MRRPSGPTIAALVCAVLVGLLYVSPVLKDVARTGLDWPIWIDHPEGLMNTSLGKWWVLPPHHYLVDGSSGEFPIYYQSLSDSILNVIAEPLGIPAMTVQAVLFGPLLGFSFLLLNYLSIAAVVSDRRVALVASLLISLGGNSSFLDRPDPVSGLPLNSVLHVPFHVISLATAQSLGWVLLLPCLSLTFLAHRRFSRTRAVGAGVLLAALFHSHTLTFLNVAAAQLFYFVLVNALDRPRDRRFRAWLGALALLAATFAALVATRPSLSFAIPVALGGLALAATFLVDPNKRFYLWSYGVAGLLALPYVLLLARHAAALAALQRGWDGVQMMTVGLSGLRPLLRGLPAGRGRRVPLEPGPARARLGLGPPRLDRLPRGQPPLALGQPPVPLRDPPALPARHPRGARPCATRPGPWPRSSAPGWAPCASSTRGASRSAARWRCVSGWPTRSGRPSSRRSAR